MDIVVPKTKAEDGDESAMVRHPLFYIRIALLYQKLILIVFQDVDDADVVVPTDPEDARQFSQVISGLQKSYPRDKMEEISTSFCFICLLHLANEQGLKLESAAESNVFVEKGLVEDEVDEEIISSEKKIGNIWDIKVRFLVSWISC